MKMLYNPNPVSKALGFQPEPVEVVEVDFVEDTATVVFEVTDAALVNVLRKEGSPPVRQVRRTVPRASLSRFTDD